MVQDIFLEGTSMTIRKQLSIMMFLLILASIAVNSFISTRYIDNYFRGYVSDQYDQNVDTIVTFSENLLHEGIQNRRSALSELENFIDDPIIGIAIYDNSGERIAYAEDAMYSMHRNMMMGRRFDIESDTIDLIRHGETIGVLEITRNSDVQSSETVWLFKKAMLIGTAISGGIVFLLAWVLIVFSSKHMAKGLRDTADYAKSIELGQERPVEKSSIEEIKSLQLSLENLSSRLKLQKAARKQKTDQLAHETRTPLTILRTHCEGALDGVIEMDDTRLESCMNEIDNLYKLIENMNDVIEYSTETTGLTLTEYDLVQEIKKVIKGLGLQFRRKGLDLTYEGPAHYRVKQDMSLLNQALYNLLTNAYKFTDSGQVQVFLEVAEDGAWTLRVKDTGQGISLGDQNRIFEAYYRSARTQSVEGDGLGLYLTQQNVERLGGQLNVDSELGQGSVFSIEFS
jgi:signal transduction histidine kinase